MKPYTLGVYEKALPNSLTWQEKFACAKASGFDTLEISIDESDERLRRLMWSSKERAAFRQASLNEDVPVWTMCLSAHRKYPLGSHDAELRAKSLEIMERAVDLAASLGVRIIQLAGYDVYYEQGDEHTRAWFLLNLQKCVELAAARGVSLGFETMETPFLDTVEKAMKYVRVVHSPYLGVYPDIGNLHNACLKYGGDVAAELCKGNGHLFAAHLKETKAGVYRNLDIGETGAIPYVDCIRELYGMGVRMFTGEFWHKGEADYAAVLKRSADFLRTQIEQGIDEALAKSGLAV